MPPRYTLADLAGRLGGRVRGDPHRAVLSFRPLDEAGPEDLSFLGAPRYRAAAERSAAGALLVGEPLLERGGTLLPGRDLLIVADPYQALPDLVPLFFPPPAAPSGVSERAVVAADAVLGEGVFVGPLAVVGARCRLGARARLHAGVVLGEGCMVGEDTVLHPNVSVYPGVVIGSRVIVHGGAVLGSDGFGFATAAGRHRKIPQVGGVRIGDDVEIGANVTIDRGALGDTVVGRGSKIDNLVQIAHNVRVGEDCLLVAQSGLAGSTHLGRGSVIAGQSGAAGHLSLGERVVVAAKTAVFDDVADGTYVAGIPAVDHRTWKRASAIFARLPELRSEVRAILRRLEALEGRPGEE